MVCV
ncbi:hypothetical protein Taro_004785 [Colocasia esculenta]|jgi:hypothetical protein